MRVGPATPENPPADAEPCAEKSGVRVTSALGSTRLRFDRAAAYCVLTIEAPARDDLIRGLYCLLRAESVQVIRVHAQVLGDRTLHELAMVDVHGAKLSEEHWQDVQASILEHLGDKVAPFGPELSFTRCAMKTARQAAE